MTLGFFDVILLFRLFESFSSFALVALAADLRTLEILMAFARSRCLGGSRQHFPDVVYGLCFGISWA